jgi:hypothetical protein
MIRGQRHNRDHGACLGFQARPGQVWVFGLDWFGLYWDLAEQLLARAVYGRTM